MGHLPEATQHSLGLDWPVCLECPRLFPCPFHARAGALVLLMLWCLLRKLAQGFAGILPELPRTPGHWG